MEQLYTFLVNNWLLLTGFVAVLFLLIAYEFSIRYGGAEKVTPQQAVRLMNTCEGIVLDMRDSEKFKQGHIQGATNMPLKDLAGQIAKINRFKDKPIIIVDEMGLNAAQAAKTLIANGFEKCHVMQGGLQGWRDASLPLAKKVSKDKDKANANAKMKGNVK